MNFYSLKKNRRLMSLYKFHLMQAKLLKGYWLTYDYSLIQLPRVLTNIFMMRKELVPQLNKKQV